MTQALSESVLTTTSLSTSAVTQFNFPATTGLTVHYVLSVIKDRNRKNYPFLKSGYGYRFWE